MLGAPYPSSVRYEEAAQAAFDSAAEGEDPCHPDESHRHDARAQSVKEPKPDAAQAQTHKDAQEDLMRAVVMSEVLKRPAQRREERAARHLHRAAKPARQNGRSALQNQR